MAIHLGSCHCGQVKFRILGNVEELTTCDCSLCRKKNALMTKVHESAFELLVPWDRVTEYQWNTNTAKHYFCRTCGIYTFHRKRAQPDHFGVNVYCLDDYDPTRTPVRATDGASMTVTSSEARDVWPGPRREE